MKYNTGFFNAVVTTIQYNFYHNAQPSGVIQFKIPLKNSTFCLVFWFPQTVCLFFSFKESTITASFGYYFLLLFLVFVVVVAFCFSFQFHFSVIITGRNRLMFMASFFFSFWPFLMFSKFIDMNEPTDRLTDIKASMNSIFIVQVRCERLRSATVSVTFLSIDRKLKSIFANTVCACIWQFFLKRCYRCLTVKYLVWSTLSYISKWTLFDIPCRLSSNSMGSHVN